MRLRVLLVILFFFLASSVPLAFAQSPQSTPVGLPKSQTINQNYFGTGSMVDVEGTVNGDAYLAGGTILVNGTVNGDILAAGGQITIHGNVHNVRVVGGQVVIDGKINGNVTMVGGSLTITSGSTIAGSVVGAGGVMYISSPIGKTLTLGGGQVNIENVVGGNTSVAANHLFLTSNAKIHGALWYVSQANAQIDKGAVVAGKITHAYPPQKKSTSSVEAFFAGLGVFFTFTKIIFELIVGVALIALAPFYTGRMLDAIRTSAWPSFGIGLLAWILTPILFILLLITLIGIPFAFLMVVGVILFSYLGKIFAALFLGNWALQRVNQKNNNLYWALIVGIIVLEIIGLLPFIGWLFDVIVSVIGFGAVLILEKNYYTELRAKKLL